ncbi:methyltransferase domain-containing protein [Kitasatospora sp. NBC_01287]|uniref:methyltransferase domain-containing protein n=1 Tax=Kitasatospora sp. NBC_01287 TaxID=2903573 RepID=UPI00224FDF41|nr:methyltransferase domain-containing protein [Kitasatospora sp. NBC_01287]MCX4747754.1 methyltransferase domain-containing protein [Kitasatospora sp. NBC_01287]
MTPDLQLDEQAASRGLLRSVADDLGHEIPGEWARALTAVPRHLFIPALIRVGDDNEPLARADDPAGWLRASYANAPVVTQVNDGADPGDGDVWPSSSASMPSVVVRMLEDLDVREGMRVLEIGTGTGWNAGLLAHRLGDANVTSVEVDARVAATARAALGAAGLRPEVVRADGAAGWPPRRPFDRIISTCAVNRVPTAWLAQARPGAVILTPWENPWIGWGTLRLVVGDGRAEGRFLPYGSFMLMRSHRTNLRIFRDVVSDDHQPDESTTELDPWVVAGADAEIQFAIGSRLGDVWHARQHDPDVDGVAVRLWLATTDASSWAAVDWDGAADAPRFTVWQHGPRRLWAETEAAHRWWLDNHRPGPHRFGLTLTHNAQHIWLDDPDTELPRSRSLR